MDAHRQEQRLQWKRRPRQCNALVWEQQHHRLMKHLSRAQTRAALHRVYALLLQDAWLFWICPLCCEAFVLQALHPWPGPRATPSALVFMTNRMLQTFIIVMSTS